MIRQAKENALSECSSEGFVDMYDSCRATEGSAVQGEGSALDSRTNEFTAIPTTPEEYLTLVRQQVKTGPKVVAIAKEGREGGLALLHCTCRNSEKYAMVFWKS